MKHTHLEIASRRIVKFFGGHRLLLLGALATGLCAWVAFSPKVESAVVTQPAPAPIKASALPVALPQTPVSEVAATPATAALIQTRDPSPINLSALVQLARASNDAGLKSNAASAIRSCTDFDAEKILRSVRASDAPDLNVSAIQAAVYRKKADCQTLTQHDYLALKELAQGAYRLRSTDGAYLLGSEVGIPEKAADRKIWLDALKSAAYAGHALSHMFVDKEVGKLFDDQDEALGFRMAGFRVSGVSLLDGVSDRVFYAWMSRNPLADPNSAGAKRSFDVMHRLMKAQAKQPALLGVGQSG